MGVCGLSFKVSHYTDCISLCFLEKFQGKNLIIGIWNNFYINQQSTIISSHLNSAASYKLFTAPVILSVSQRKGYIIGISGQQRKGDTKITNSRKTGKFWSARTLISVLSSDRCTSTKGKYQKPNQVHRREAKCLSNRNQYKLMKNCPMEHIHI